MSSRKLKLWELSAILGGLRLVQQQIAPVRGGENVDEVLTNGDKLPLPTVEQINELCNKLNSTDWCER